MARTKQTARKSTGGMAPRQMLASFAQAYTVADASSSDSEEEVVKKKARSESPTHSDEDAATSANSPKKLLLHPDYELPTELATHMLRFFARDSLDRLRGTCRSNRNFIDTEMTGKCRRQIVEVSVSYDDNEPDYCNNPKHRHLWNDGGEPEYVVSAVALRDGKEVKKESRFEEDRVKDAAKYLSRLLRNGELNDFTFLSESDFLKAFKRYAVLLKLAINGTLKFTSSDAVPSAAARDIIECFTMISVIYIQPQNDVGVLNDGFLRGCLQHNVARLYLPNRQTPNVKEDGILEFCFGSDAACECPHSSVAEKARMLKVCGPQITSDFLSRLVQAHGACSFTNRLQLNIWRLFPGNPRALVDRCKDAVKQYQDRVTANLDTARWILEFLEGDMLMKVDYNIGAKEILVKRAHKDDAEFLEMAKKQIYHYYGLIR